MSNLVIYFSRSNNTKTGAEYLAEKIDGAIVELTETKGRKGILGFFKSGFQSVTKKKSTLKDDPWDKISGFTNIYLMTPIWASNGTPAMNSFVEKADFSEKQVVLITFQADVNKESSGKVHNYYKSKIEAKKAASFSAAALHSALPGKYAGEEHIQSQIDDFIKSNA